MTSNFWNFVLNYWIMFSEFRLLLEAMIHCWINKKKLMDWKNMTLNVNLKFRIEKNYVSSICNVVTVKYWTYKTDKFINFDFVALIEILSTIPTLNIVIFHFWNTCSFLIIFDILLFMDFLSLALWRCILFYQIWI